MEKWVSEFDKLLSPFETVDKNVTVKFVSEGWTYGDFDSCLLFFKLLTK